jgi:hypothetical protein
MYTRGSQPSVTVFGAFKSTRTKWFLDMFLPIELGQHWRGVCHAVTNCLSSGHMDEEINTTHIVLVPKKPNPTSMTEYRPISFCNVLYKITSKVLANHLKVVLPYIISPN